MAKSPAYDDSPKTKELIESLTYRKIRKPIAVIETADNYMAIGPGMILQLNEERYFITGEAREGRFGIDDQPKMWVKYAIDLTDGSRKIIKLPFLEQFQTKVGPFTITCKRNPEKESRVLDMVRHDPRFMHGHTSRDASGANVRIIEEIRGRSLYGIIADLDISHEEYFFEILPGIMKKLLDALDALAALHAKGEQHGDVRSDHILQDADTRRYRWIDFDYEANYTDYDVWSVGNIVAYVVGQGNHNCKDVAKVLDERNEPCLEAKDSQLFFQHRLINLKKLFSYIPDSLNDILMRFSKETVDFYDSTEQIISDLRSLY